jgi:integrase
MAVYKRGNTWWYKFNWRGERVYESAKTKNKRVARDIEAARKTQLARGEVGLKDRAPVPTLAEFTETRFLPFVQRTFAAKPRTLEYYSVSVKGLLSTSHLKNLALDVINAEAIARHAEAKRTDGLKISSVNRQLQVLRRIFKLAEEWDEEKQLSRLAKVKLLPGEARRERVLTGAEENRYLAAASEIGNAILAAHERAQEGIRATQRGQQPIAPRDPYILRDFATILVDCALRPEEAFRLRREHTQDSALMVPYGKTRKARRRIPLPDRSRQIVEARLRAFDSEWLFPAPTMSGHAEPSTIRDHHAKAVEASGVPPFVLYALRHTCLTRWAAHMDPYTLGYLAGHSSFVTTERYVHPQRATVEAAMKRAGKVGRGDKSGDSKKSGRSRKTA